MQIVDEEDARHISRVASQAQTPKDCRINGTGVLEKHNDKPLDEDKKPDGERKGTTKPDATPVRGGKEDDMRQVMGTEIHIKQPIS